jgi:ribonucleoside-diphosphate reductase alpha chain
MKFERVLTDSQKSPESQVEWTTNAKGVEAPAAWSETAVEIAATKYFRRQENSVRQLIHRVARTVRLAGEWQKVFTSQEQPQIFEDELKHILLHQMASFNSPVYFNVGLFPLYGVLGGGENYIHSQPQPLSSSYVHPQASACFIQDVRDDLLSIFDLLKSEAKLFKYGSGTGTNFSRLRAKGEALEGGGESTGLISYLEIYDKAAQAIKSGGTTRRAAKMVVLDADHPEILEFIRWKMLEERKARVLLANGYSGGMEGEAFRTVSGQNSNNSVRVTDDFLKRAIGGGTWTLKARKGGRPVSEIPARDLLKEMARAAWECADPGIQYHDTIQKWHMCPRSGEIRSSNPCSEYMFLDDSACNLASLNLAAFLDPNKNDLDWAAFKQAVRVMLFAQEILVDYSSYPTKKIADNSHRFRPLGLGYANLGGMLMRMGIPYESEAAARWTTKITAAMHALALETSQKMAEAQGAFEGWAENKIEALAVLEQHAKAWREQNPAANSLGGEEDDWIGKTFARTLTAAAQSGLRNAQVTLIAPTGTIGLFMDCDTLGIEPDFSLIKRKTLASGGEFRLVNRSVGEGLKRLGYSAHEIAAIENHIATTGGAAGAKELKQEHLSVFDCAVSPARYPERRISPGAHLQIMAAAQPFLSGAISKTINLPASTTVEEIEKLFLDGWKLGLKSLAVYRDGSKALQPLCAEC